MKGLFPLIKPVLHALDPEDAHTLTIAALKSLPFCPPAMKSDPILKQTLLGLDFAHPLGLAAGFDKNAETMRAMTSFGMGHVEIGTVTPRGQIGNDRPRVFRDAPSHSVINRMGFPNRGADVFFANLRAYRSSGGRAIVGVNIGKNKDSEDALADYTQLAARAAGLADYVTINISSPNTPGLRDLQNGDFVRRCAEGVKAVFKKTVLVKLAPDLDDALLADLAEACLSGEVDGVILTNTTLDRPEFLPPAYAAQKGGLSGAPLTEKSLDVLRRFYALTDGQIPLIGVGGIENAQDAYARIRAGASLIQLYTSLVFQGASVIEDITKGLPALLRQDGFETIDAAVGADHR